MKEYEKCMLCLRTCGVNRTAGEHGYCKSDSIPHISRAALHMWEEPIISGTRGSGTVFFSGCSLGCVFCQNSKISREQVGVPMNEAQIADTMLKLQSEGAHNINFVTPTHFAPSIIKAVRIARGLGLDIPIVYNTGSLDSVETVRMLHGTVDVYLPDFKFFTPSSAKKLAHEERYPENARLVIDEMIKSVGNPVINDGIIERGVVVRVLLLPAHVAEAKLIVKYLYNKYGNSIYLSLMSQYTPMENVSAPLNRKVTRSEYRELCDYAASLGVSCAFVQSIDSAGENFIPHFDTSKY